MQVFSLSFYNSYLRHMTQAWWIGVNISQAYEEDPHVTYKLSCTMYVFPYSYLQIESKQELLQVERSFYVMTLNLRLSIMVYYLEETALQRRNEKHRKRKWALYLLHDRQKMKRIHDGTLNVSYYQTDLHHIEVISRVDTAQASSFILPEFQNSIFSHLLQCKVLKK